ncbi:GH16 domain-containing protein [Mycena venus]|uniref:GH16 domain-containing protein n=1 Tax=Mycena venus TaxID=2733690 RepID=A0A8H6X510_9AGAR|nr:GH16 domain-containing protein [Mycena venus]
MHTLCSLVLLLHPFTTLADTPFKVRHYGRSYTATQTYALKDYFTGDDLLTWDFFSASDPTHGDVNYLTKADAIAKGLAYIQKDGTTILAVDGKSHLKAGESRDSVRISSPKSYTYGLFITDIWAMPHGPTVWPAYWTVGPDWPNNGEIDIIEVKDFISITLVFMLPPWTGRGCFLDTSVASEFTGQQTEHSSCSSSSNDNDGCGVTDSGAHVYGHNFNAIGGGIYAHIVASSGIKIWHFPRNEIPTDIISRSPNPANWDKPVAFWSSLTCNISEHFKDHVITFDTTLCGDWAGNSFPGGIVACTEAVADPVNYALAQWKINYVAVYENFGP